MQRDVMRIAAYFHGRERSMSGEKGIFVGGPSSALPGAHVKPKVVSRGVN